MRKLNLLAVFALFFGALFIASPASPVQADPGGCLSTNFCLHDTPTSLPMTQAGADTPRNTCITLSPALAHRASFITNHTGVQWYAFRTYGCVNAHFTSYAYTNQNLTTVSGWDNAINSYYRTALLKVPGTNGISFAPASFNPANLNVKQIKVPATVESNEWCSSTSWFCVSSLPNGNGNKWHYTVTGARGGYSWTRAPDPDPHGDIEWYWNRTQNPGYVYLGSNCDQNTGTGGQNRYIFSANSSFNTVNISDGAGGNWANRGASFSFNVNYNPDSGLACALP